MRENSTINKSRQQSRQPSREEAVRLYSLKVREMNKMKALSSIQRSIHQLTMDNGRDGKKRSSVSIERSLITGREDAETAASIRNPSVMTSLVVSKDASPMR